jgi:uncharacterized membrane protein HdeD (DUF308 family)
MMLARRWWILAIRGAAAMLFGLLTFVAPASSLYALIILFGAYAIVDGAFDIGLAFRGQHAGRHWGSLLFQGAISIAAGVLTFMWPKMSALVLLLVIAAWAVITGASALAAAVRLRKHIQGEWLLGLAGLLSIAFGLLLFVYPGPGALAVIIWIGAYAIVYGGLLLALAFRLRRWARTSERSLPTHGGLHVPA